MIIFLTIFLLQHLKNALKRKGKKFPSQPIWEHNNWPEQSQVPQSPSEPFLLSWYSCRWWLATNLDYLQRIYLFLGPIFREALIVNKVLHLFILLHERLIQKVLRNFVHRILVLLIQQLLQGHNIDVNVTFDGISLHFQTIRLKIPESWKCICEEFQELWRCLRKRDLRDTLRCKCRIASWGRTHWRDVPSHCCTTSTP